MSWKNKLIIPIIMILLSIGWFFAGMRVSNWKEKKNEQENIQKGFNYACAIFITKLESKFGDTTSVIKNDTLFINWNALNVKR